MHLFSSEERILPPWSPMRPLVVKIMGLHSVHQSQGKNWQGMVGKLVRKSPEGYVFLTSHKSTLYHQLSDCPCPIDTIVAEWLVQGEIPWLHSYDKNGQQMLSIRPTDLTQAEVFFHDGMRRYAPPRSCWITLDGVERQYRKRKGDEHGLWRYVVDGGRVLIEEPWIEESVYLQKVSPF